MQRMASTQITWQDTLLMPEDGKRYEAIAGDLYVTAAPSFRHQWISGRLYVALDQLLYPEHGRVLAAPVGVEFPDTEEGVQPDLVFISHARSAIAGQDWIRGAPDLIVEMLSPSTAERDRSIKRKLYERQSVAQYWIVDPETKTIEVWDFAARATGPQRYVDQVPVRVGGEQVAELDLSSVFPPPTNL